MQAGGLHHVRPRYTEGIVTRAGDAQSVRIGEPSHDGHRADGGKWRYRLPQLPPKGAVVLTPAGDLDPGAGRLGPEPEPELDESR
jgi:hypothetical protein